MIDDLESLESVKIGENCFRISYEERNDGVCRITNCPNLRQLEIGKGSIEDFKSFELFNVNSIQSMTFGDCCLKFVCEFIFDGLGRVKNTNNSEINTIDGVEERDGGLCRITNCPNLRQLDIGDDCLIIIESINISNLNSIQSIKFGDSCFRYDDFSLKGEWKEWMKEMWFEWKWKMMF